MRLAAGALIASLLVVPAAAADDAKDQLRDDLAALVAWVPGGYGGGPADAASPTALVNRIVARGDAKVRPELKTLWRLATTDRSEASEHRRAVAETILFLYGLGDPKEPPIRLVDGAVVAFEPPHGKYEFGSFEEGGGPEKKAPPAFEALVKGGKLRAASKPQAAKLVEALQRAEVAKWDPLPQSALARAAGETCTGVAAAKLVAMATQQPTDPVLSTALAWSGAPEAEAELRGRVASLAPRVADGKTAAAPLLAAAVRGLAHVKREALFEEFAKLSGPALSAALAADGGCSGLGWALDRAEKAAPGNQPAELDLVGACIGDGAFRAVPGDMKRLVRFLDSAASSPGTRDQALVSAEKLLYGFNRYPITNSSSMNGVSESVEGARLGPNPDMGTLLHSLAADLESGAIAFGDDRSSIWDEPSAEAASGWFTPDAAVGSPMPNHGGPDKGAPVRVTGALADDGLRITLTNKTAKPFSVAAPALRYGTVELVTVKLSQAGKETSFSSLKLSLGFIRANVTTPATALVTVAPGANWSWTVPIRPEHRAVDHISVECNGMIRVTGTPAVPVLSRFGEAWIK